MGIGKTNPNPKGKAEDKTPPPAARKAGDTAKEAAPKKPNGKSHTSKAQEKLKQQQLEGTGERLDIIHKCVDQVQALQNDRKAIQAKVQAVREQVESLGVSKAAFDMAMRYLKMDEDQRQGFDLAYAMTRKAIGLPINQADLFTDVQDESTTH